MIVKLKDAHETILNLNKVSAVRKHLPYIKKDLDGTGFLCNSFIMYVMIGFEKIELTYYTHGITALEGCYVSTPKSIKKAGKKFLSDYKLIEEYLLNKHA